MVRGSVGLHAKMGPDQQVGVTQPQLLSPWLQSGAFAQANPRTMPMWGQAAAAQPQPQAVQFSQHTAAAWHAPVPPVYQAASQPQLAPIVI